MQTVRIAVAVVCEGDRVLVGTRSTAPFEGYAEFPGGKVEPGESSEDAAVRECQEEAGVVVVAERVLAEVPYRAEGIDLRIAFVACRFPSPEPGRSSTPPQSPFRWVRRVELGELSFPPANRPVIEALMEPEGGIER